MKQKTNGTNISQIETTMNMNNQSITSRRNEIRLPQLYNHHDFRVLTTKRIKGMMDLDESSQEVIKQLKLTKKEIFKIINEHKAEEGIEIVKKLSTQCTSYDILIFSKSIHLLADMYISAREFANGLYCYNLLRMLADVSKDLKLKIEALIQMADLCKLQQLYRYCEIFLKKALQYIWLQGDQEAEATIYDYFGVLYYVQGELRRAKEFHDRSMNFISESIDSASRIHGIDYAKSYMKKQTYHSIVVNQMVLSKLGMIQGNETDLKLGTHLEFPILLEQILEDTEFQVEISTPNRPNRIITKNGELQSDIVTFKSVKDLHDRQAKIRFFEKKIPEMRITKSLLKRTIEEQLEQRMHVDKKQESIDSYKKWLQRFHTYRSFPEKLEKVNINHLSPNRNLIGFKYNFKPMKKQLFELINEIEFYIYEQS